MENGQFDHLQYTLRAMSDELKIKADTYLSPAVRQKLTKTADSMNLTAVMMQKVDQFLAGAEDHDSFVEKFEESIRQTFTSSELRELRLQLSTAISLLRDAECTGEAYIDIKRRGQWRTSRDLLISQCVN